MTPHIWIFIVAAETGYKPMEANKTVKHEPDHEPPVAVLEHLTGPARGTVTWLGDAGFEVSVLAGQRPQVRGIGAEEPGKNALARLRRTNGSFEIEALPAHTIWVNGKPVTSAQLKNHDTIEFGATGPISRFCICASRRPLQRSFTSPISDSIAYFRASRRPFFQKATTACLLAIHRLLFETTYVFRIGVIIALAALAVIAYQQAHINAIVGEQISAGTSRLDELALTLARNREQAITPADLETLSSDLSSQIETAAQRLTRLERLSTATARIIREKHRAVLMVQSAYGFRDRESGRMLRNILGPEGKPSYLPNGLLMLSLEGDGPIAERNFIGTAFAVGDSGVLVTNRHVAIPWEKDAVAATVSVRGLEPVIRKLIVYVPGMAEALPASLMLSSDKDDLALLRLQTVPNFLVGLQIAEEVPKPGAEIIVMGYPTGLRTLLAQAGREFIDALQETGNVGFWSIAERLAKAGKIVPLASRGILGSVSDENLVYDAETTHGGSGGPVFDNEGRVIAVNTAILPEYGGSNLGIPADRIRKLLDEAAVGG